MEMKVPNFLIIGAGKSGTTSVYHYLKEHPEVFMSTVKETNFFALEGEKIETRDDDSDQMYHYPWSVNNWEQYLDLFKDASLNQIRGEASPMYLYSSKAAESIKTRVPDVKLIAVLRQPSERLYSRYLHLARENRVPGKFEDALDEKSIWWKRNDLINEGRYHTHLSKYFELFPENQIKVILYDDLKKDQNAVMKEIYSFLGVNPNFVPDTDQQHNVSGIIKNKTMDLLIGQNSWVKERISQLSPELMRRVKGSKRLKSLVNGMRNKNLSRPAMSFDMKRALDEIYKSEIDSLSNLIDRNLDHWKVNTEGAWR